MRKKELLDLRDYQDLTFRKLSNTNRTFRYEACLIKFKIPFVTLDCNDIDIIQ